ncbi:hypothetical protein MNBD_PLANCTO02-1870 [hydrothermal vent metagenome]|uniref:Lipoyl-binding domain-containing protein n=1 Tax=hydrothermal vent metagenome TaxID=652676 RepID=A0A3B1DL26_9ZZZZ
MQTPVIVPDLKCDETLRVCSWLVEVGENIEQGDRLVELLTTGMTFDVAAPVSGRISSIEKSRNTFVSEGEILGWMTTDVDKNV